MDVLALRPSSGVAAGSSCRGPAQPRGSRATRPVVCKSSQSDKIVISRRGALVGLAGLAAAAWVPSPAFAKGDAGDWSSPGLATPVDDNAPKFIKTDSGIKIQELAAGSGPQPQNGDRVLIDYVLRRPNGYFIYSTVEGVSFQPRDVPVGPVSFVLGKDTQWIQGLQEVVSRMKQGGKVRALIPGGDPTGYLDCNKDEPQPPTFATKRQLVNYCKGPLLFEVQLLRVLPAGSS